MFPCCFSFDNWYGENAPTESPLYGFIDVENKTENKEELNKICQEVDKIFNLPNGTSQICLTEWEKKPVCIFFEDTFFQEEKLERIRMRLEPILKGFEFGHFPTEEMIYNEETSNILNFPEDKKERPVQKITNLFARSQKLILRVTPNNGKTSEKDLVSVSEEFIRIFNKLLINSDEISSSTIFSVSDSCYVFFFMNYYFKSCDYNFCEDIANNWEHHSTFERYTRRKNDKLKFLSGEDEEEANFFYDSKLDPKKHVKIGKESLIGFKPLEEEKSTPFEERHNFELPKRVEGSDKFTEEEKNFLISVGKNMVKLPYFTCYNDQFKYFDFVNFLLGRTVDLEKDDFEKTVFFMKLGIKKLLSCVCAKITTGEENHYIFKARDAEKSFDLNFTDIVKRRKTDMIFFRGGHKEDRHNIWSSLLFEPGYNGTCFKPYFPGDKVNDGSEECRRLGFNLFQGYPFARRPAEKPDMALVQPVLDFIYGTICNKEKLANDYFIKTLAFIFRHHCLSKIAIILFSAIEGCGKGKLMWFIINYCLGVANSAYSYSGDGITTNFNGLSENSVLTIIDEAESGAKKYDQCKEQMGKFKSMITESKRKLEKKYQNARMVDNIQNLVFCTNNKNCVSIKPGNRRFFFIHCDEKTANDRVFFEKIGKCLTAEAGYHFFSYLYNMNINKDEFLETHHPVTELELEVLGGSENKICKFIRSYFIDEDGEFFNDQQITTYYDKEKKPDKIFISSQSLHTIFKNEYGSNMSASNFKINFEEECGKLKVKFEITRRTIHGSKLRGYLFTLSEQKVNF